MAKTNKPKRPNGAADSGTTKEIGDRGDDYDVGYARPPKSGQFKKGQSGNPRGRKKGTRNLATDLRDELKELILLSEGGKQKKISKQRALLKVTVAKGIKGDVRATRTILNLMSDLLSDDEADKSEAPLVAEEKDIFDALLKRAARIKAGEVEDDAE